jgi:iron complex outermembrane recepter protein
MSKRWAALALALWLLPASLWAATTITGTVTAAGAGEPDVTVLVGEASTTTDAEGRYALEVSVTGPQTLLAVKEGYQTVEQTVEVPASGTLTQDIALEPDLTYSDTLVVTGTRTPTTKRESSVAITTMSERQIEETAPRSTADLLSTIPGFYVESSGGEVGGNLFARGLPADGSYRYVALMEDGMPVFDATELFFVNADIFVRVDENIAEVEAVRGGNSALFGSNAPGGVINFLSKTGGTEPHTDLKLTTGTDGLWRVGFNTNGPVNENWTYSIGGFYRSDEGVRDPGFTASDGGQIKLNLTRNLDNGLVRFYAKYLDDSNIFYLPLPFRADRDQDFVAGFPSDGTLTSPEGNGVQVPLPNQQGLLTLPLDDGQRQRGYSLMAEISLQLASGWTLQNLARQLDIDHSWNAMLPFDLVSANDFARSFVPAGGSFRYSYTNHQEAFSTPNGLVQTAGLWHVEKPLESFADQLQLSRSFTAGTVRHDVAVGTYLSFYKVGNTWYFNDVLADVRNQPRFLDLTVFDAQGRPTRVTENGFTRYGSNFVNARGEVQVAAVFAGDQIQLSDRLRLDLGARYERNQFRQFENLTSTFDLGDPTTQADDRVVGSTGALRRAEQTFSELAGSIGVNYLINDRVALWGRASSGYKMPILDNYLFGGRDLEAEQLVQAELGTRIGTPTWGINSSLYFLQISDFPSQDVRVVNGETVFVTDFVGEAETIGLETELIARPVPALEISGSITLQQPEYTNFVEGERNFNGNRIRRIPEYFLDLTGSYDFDPLRVALHWSRYGDRFSNNANTIVLDDYDVVNFTAFYPLSPSLELQLAVLNVLNGEGLTEGNPRLDESGGSTGAAFLARPILPRRTTLALQYRF